MELLSDLIFSFDPSNPNFRPTELYNESWLVKLVLQQAANMADKKYPLSFLTESTWYSEALLPSAFKARYQGDKLSESRTNADGVVGHFQIGSKGKADLELDINAKQFTVVEAKMGAPLSKGTSNAKHFDQAVRNVACMAEVLHRAKIEPQSVDHLGFVVLAPKYSIEKGTFTDLVTNESIRDKVDMRVSAYDGDLKEWYSEAFLPLMDAVSLYCLSWEETFEWIEGEIPNQATQLMGYYDLCLEFN